MRFLVLSGLEGLLCGAALIAAPVLAQGADAARESARVRPSPEATALSNTRLESVRNALIDQALEAPVRVSSSSWVDESGRLRHVSRFFSEVRARAAADLVFAPEGGGPASGAAERADGGALAGPKPLVDPAAAAGASMTQSAAAVKTDPVVAACSADRSGLLRMASIHTELVPGDGARGHAVLHEAARVYQDALRRLAGSGGMVLAAAAPTPLNAYERLLSDTGGGDTPYRVEIRLSSDRVDIPPHGNGAHPGKGPVRQGINAVVELSREFSMPPVALLPSRRLDLSVALRESVSQKVVRRHSVQVHVPGSSPGHNTQTLPDSSIEALRMAASTWWDEAIEALSCEPILVQAAPSSGGRVNIPLGGSAGVRLGDKWLVADRSRIPSRVLEEGSIERALVAEVVAVMPHRSVLKFTPDAAHLASRLVAERGVTWFATPM